MHAAFTIHNISQKWICTIELLEILKGYSTFLEIGSFYHSPRVKQLGLTIFECIQQIF